MELDPVPAEDQARQWWGYNAVARLALGVSLAQARARAERVADGFVDRFADVYRPSEEYTVSLQPLEWQITRDVRTPLMVLFVTVGAVLLIACINVANLLLVRAEDAQPEIALRSALGASSGEMARPFVIESESVLSMSVDFPEWQYGDMEEVSQVHEGILASAANVAGVQSVALAHADHPPRLKGQWYFAPEGLEADPEATKSMVGIRVASPGYLETLRIPLLSGPPFQRSIPS